MHLAVISPRDGFAGLLDESTSIVTLVSPAGLEGNQFSIGSYVARFPDTTLAQVDSPDDVRSQLSSCRAHVVALDSLLMLFDGRLSANTRRQLARELDDMLSQSKTRDHLLDVLLASPLPPDADLAGAADAVAESSRPSQLIALILNSQERVKLAEGAWLSMRENQFVRAKGADNVLGAMIRCGAFRRLVVEGQTRTEIDRLRPVILLALKSYCDPRAINSFISAYAANLPAGSKRVEANAPMQSALATDAEIVVDFDNSDSRGWHHQWKTAEKQVDAIAEAYRDGNQSRGDEYLADLVHSQSQKPKEHPHLIKSLCNIATKCTGFGRRDVALRSLTMALEYPTGFDAILFKMLGDALRALRRFDEALACYNQARVFDDGGHRDILLLDVVRVSIANRDFDSALAQLTAIPSANERPDVMCLFGTLHRRKADLIQAHKWYEGALKIDPNYHQAQAGIAEANKQAGRHAKAVRRYEQILGDGEWLPEMSRRVYSLSLASLYRLMLQFDRAQRLLSSMLASSPTDPDVHLQLAKLHALLGEHGVANAHFAKAVDNSLDSVAADFYLAATKSAVAMPSIGPVEFILPEDRAIASCVAAIGEIDKRKYENALRIIDRANYVDRIHQDFGAILSFHARKCLDPDFNYKREYTFARLAKQGHSVVRNAIQAIASNDFGAAREIEQRFCLLVA